MATKTILSHITANYGTPVFITTPNKLNSSLLYKLCSVLYTYV